MSYIITIILFLGSIALLFLGCYIGHTFDILHVWYGFPLFTLWVTAEVVLISIGCMILLNKITEI